MKKITVLLVDDDTTCTFLCQKVLDSIEVTKQVYTARNGMEALEVLDKCLSGEVCMPDLILLDLSMPIMDGFQFIHAFKNLHFYNKDRILIVITSSSID
jgi:CheY-like chemotaxis protein